MEMGQHAAGCVQADCRQQDFLVAEHPGGPSRANDIAYKMDAVSANADECPHVGRPVGHRAKQLRVEVPVEVPISTPVSVMHPCPRDRSTDIKLCGGVRQRMGGAVSGSMAP